MEAQEVVVLQILFEFEYRERNGPFSCFDSFSFFSFQKFLLVHILFNANAYDANDMIKC